MNVDMYSNISHGREKLVYKENEILQIGKKVGWEVKFLPGAGASDAGAACAGAGRGRDDKVARRRPLCRNDGEAKKNGQGYGKDGRDVETWRLCRVPVLCQGLVYAQHHPLDSDLISSYLCLYLIIHSFIYLYFFFTQ